VKFCNFTPHDVNIVSVVGQSAEGSTIIDIPQESGLMIRCEEKTELVETEVVDGKDIRVVKKIFGEPFVCKVEDARTGLDEVEVMPLPAQQEGVTLIVSFIAARGLKEIGRTDFVLTEGRVMDPEDPKKFLGCTGLATL
jgi:hypothetical protein